MTVTETETETEHTIRALAHSVAVPPAFARMRRFPMRGALLLFDRDTGTNVLCDGAETAGLDLVAPRVVQFGITNRCNLACTFCSRDLDAESAWTVDSAFAMLAGLAAAGVLEVAFGGGEPWTFKGFATLVRRLHAETPLAVNFTTNGLALTRDRLTEVAGAFGQLRLSLYDDNDWRARVALCAETGARFGVNYLVTPERLATLETTVLELVTLGCPDILLLSYNGADRALHLSPDEARSLAARVTLLGRALGRRTRLALDVCWGDRLEAVPRLIHKPDCGAGREFIVVTSDQRV
ncbi:MAG: radical SAM protein, partial [Deltaproteobacteria bacterium]|nr:radical SAM protein [Deltaproteobacteria bacterium]